MTPSTAEEAMRQACDRMLAGDYMGAMADLTPEAISEAMMMANGLTAVTVPTSYEIQSHEEINGDHRFRVRFQAQEQELRAWATWRQVEGAWKITSIGIEPR